MLKIYTDGACSKNPGPGGYGIIVMNDDDNVIYYDSKYENDTTNNIQEIKALIHGFAFAKLRPQEKCIIYSDSAYAIGVFTQWIQGWERNGWVKSDGGPIKNLSLIQKGYQIFRELSNCEVVKVKGHNENIGNEMADALASNNIIKFNKYLEKNNRKD